MQDLSTLTRDRIHAPPAVEVQGPNHWMAREVPAKGLDEEFALGWSRGVWGEVTM